MENITAVRPPDKSVGLDVQRGSLKKHNGMSGAVGDGQNPVGVTGKPVGNLKVPGDINSSRPNEGSGEDIRQRLEKALETANKAMEPFDRRLDFTVHPDTGRNQVKVVNIETDEVIREIPSEKVLDVISRMQDMMGLLVDEVV